MNLTVVDCAKDNQFFNDYNGDCTMTVRSLYSQTTKLNARLGLRYSMCCGKRACDIERRGSASTAPLRAPVSIDA